MKIGLSDSEYISPLYLFQKKDQSDNNFYIKRDDMIPVSFGGNKARMVLKYFEDLRERNCDTVVTYGGTSSNLCRIIANMSSQYRIKCYVIAPNELSYETNNSKMIKMFGAEYIFCDVEAVHDTIEETLAYLKRLGRRPYFIPGGGHGLIGTQACLECYKEIRKYEEENEVFFDYVFLTSGTGTTQSGLIAGQIIHNDNRKIIGISEARTNPRGRQIVIDAVKDLFDSNSIQIEISSIEKRTIFLDEYTFGGYGKYSDAVTDTVKNVMIDFGIPLDRVYTGKGYFGMMDYISKNKVMDKNILFIHTGGTPLFFDYLNDNKEQL